MPRLTPDQCYPACLIKPGETLEDYMRPENAAARREIQDKAKNILRSQLKAGDKIFAIRGECGSRYAWYKFAGWSAGWIVTASGIDTIIPASVRSINKVDFRIEDYLEGPALPQT